MSELLPIREAKHVEPPCPHFGSCGGCQYQDIAYPDQLQAKEDQLNRLLRETVSQALPEIAIHSAEPYHYRNRIRLRIERVSGEFRFGYNVRTTTEFLPII